MDDALDNASASLPNQGSNALTSSVSELRQMLELPAEPNADEPVAESTAMQEILRQAKKYALSDATVLLSGESGTGKEVVARWIHQQSHRSQRPYVRVNCAALPETLMESELFGHERGASTGAVQSRLGRLAAAEDGTILLDEISEIPLALQAKLLRVLEEEEYQPLGCNDSRPVRGGSSPRPTAAWSKRWPRVSFAKTCFIGCVCSTCIYRRFVIAAKTSRVD